MAAAAARLPLSFQPPVSQPRPKPPRTRRLPVPLSAPGHRASHFAVSSVNVSSDDKPTEPDGPPAELEPAPGPEDGFDKRRLEEQFAVLNTGVYECRSCGYKYDKSVGDPTFPVPPGMDFEKLPEDWRCPTCGAPRSFFVSKSVEIAGFAQNQRFGLGGNTLTSGQKTVLIYGSLLFFFALFLSGYFLQ